MRRWAERWSLALRPLGVLLVAVSVLLVLLACRQGIGLDWDAVVYLSAAQSFADTGRIVDFRGNELSTFAPGLPVALGVLLGAGADFNTVGVGLGAVALVVTLVSTYLVARRVTSSAALAWACVAVVGLSVGTLRVFSMLKTEALFSALVMIALALCLWAIDARRAPPWWLASVAVTVSAATTVRYIGFTLIPMAVLAAVLASRGRGVRRMAGSALVVAAGASTGLASVVLRNLRLGSAPLGGRVPGNLTPSRVAADTLTVWGSYLLPFQPGGTVQTAAGLVVPALVVLAAVAAWRRRSWPGLLLLVFACGFVATVVYSEFATWIEPVSQRLLAPVFPSLVVLAVLGLSWLGGAAPDAAGRPSDVPVLVARPLALGLLAFTLISSAVSSTSLALQVGRTGVGYNSVASRTSPTAEAVRGLPRDAGVAAMNGPRVYVASGRTPIVEIPAESYFLRRDSIDAKIETLKIQARSGQVDYLVYFDLDRSTRVVPPGRLAESGIHLRKMADYPDGEVWQVTGVS